MPSSRIIRSDFRALDAFVKGFAEKRVVKVGIFGGVAHAGEAAPGGAGNLTNADVGAVMELGSVSRGIPARSFLRMPLHQKTEEILKETRKGADKLLSQGFVHLVLKRLGIACEAAIEQAFATAGFGKWKALKRATIRRKGSDRPLIDTGQLRRAVTSKVEDT